jgi:hypothetical protein
VTGEDVTLIVVGIFQLVLGIILGWSAKSYRVERAAYAADENRDAERDRKLGIGS